MKWTPGPWKVGDVVGRKIKDQWIVSDKQACPVARINVTKMENNEEIKANALLISKAPEMVEVLRDLRYWADYQHHKTMPDKLFPIIDKARSLLAELGVTP